MENKQINPRIYNTILHHPDHTRHSSIRDYYKEILEIEKKIKNGQKTPRYMKSIYNNRLERIRRNEFDDDEVRYMGTAEIEDLFDRFLKNGLNSLELKLFKIVWNYLLEIESGKKRNEGRLARNNTWLKEIIEKVRSRANLEQLKMI